MLSSKRTGLLLVILLAVIIIFILIRYTKNVESNFRTELATIDTATINNIDIKPQSSPEVKLVKESGKWLVEAEGKKYDADKGSVVNLLYSLNGAPIKSVAATSKAHWKEFKTTDSSGIRIQFKHDGDVVDDLILGKFDYIQPNKQTPNPYMRQQQGEMLSYIRIYDETPVYTIDGMLSLGMGKKVDDYRNKYLIKLDKKDISAIDIKYSNGSSLDLKKEENKWVLSNGTADSVSVAKYIASISNTRGREFSNEQPEEENLYGTYRVTLSENRDVVLKTYTKNDTSFLITSSQNPTNIINDKDGKLLEKLFVDKDQLEGKKKKEK
jgi:Domain of unknown function (DUF4340)